MPFQIHYDNVVLDTLHNYFPAMLYEPELFRTLPDVFGYARTQMQRHFDLFSAARAAYRPILPRVVPEPIRVAPNPIDIINATDLLNALRPPTGNFTNMMPGIPMNVQDLLLAMMGPPPAQNAFEDPVVVRPTAEQIARATTLESMLADDGVCAICQDTIAAMTEARTINACNHQFHKNCIDTWFQQNVRCPVCRHDIRE